MCFSTQRWLAAYCTASVRAGRTMAKGLAADKRESLSASSPERKTRVFISYSRKDAAFADALVAALNARGFEAFLDKKDILPGEPWRDRIGALILTADAVVFAISPDS